MLVKIFIASEPEVSDGIVGRLVRFKPRQTDSHPVLRLLNIELVKEFSYTDRNGGHVNVDAVEDVKSVARSKAAADWEDYWFMDDYPEPSIPRSPTVYMSLLTRIKAERLLKVLPLDSAHGRSEPTLATLVEYLIATEYEAQREKLRDE